MDKETIRQSLASMRQHLEAKGIIKPTRKEAIEIEKIYFEATRNPQDELKEIEQRSFETEEIKPEDLGF